jgi:hypothetical protein
LSGIEPRVAFMPFHFGDWDDPERHGAANELTISGWDPVSKQPFFKYAAVSVRRATVDQEPTVEPPAMEREADAPTDPGAPMPDADPQAPAPVPDPAEPVAPGGIR